MDARAGRAEVTGIAERADPPGRRVVGHGEDQLPDARPRHRAPHPRRAERAWARSTSCWPPAGSAGRAAATRTITGQGNGQGGREHGQKCDQLPGGRDIENPEHRAYIAERLGHRPGRAARAPASMPTRSSARSTAARSRGLLCICFNPMVSLPDNTFVARMLEKLEFYVAIDFFLNETARHADIVLPGSLQEEDEGVVASAEGRVIKINKAVEPPGDATPGLADHSGHRRSAWAATHGFTFTVAARDLRRAARRLAGRRRRLLRHHLREDRAATWASSGRARAEDHPGTPRLFEPGSWNPVAKGNGPFYFPDGKARFNVAAYTPPAEDVDAEYPLILTTAGWSASSCPAPRRGASARWSTSTPSRCSRCTRGWPSKLGIADGDWVTVESRRGALTLRVPGGDDDPARHGVRPLPLGRAQERQPADHRRPGPDLEDPRVQGVRRARPQGRRPAGVRRASSNRSSEPRADDGGIDAMVSDRHWSSSSTPTAASAARRACRPAASARRTRATR